MLHVAAACRILSDVRVYTIRNSNNDCLFNLHPGMHTYLYPQSCGRGQRRVCNLCLWTGRSSPGLRRALTSTCTCPSAKLAAVRLRCLCQGLHRREAPGSVLVLQTGSCLAASPRGYRKREREPTVPMSASLRFWNLPGVKFSFSLLPLDEELKLSINGESNFTQALYIPTACRGPPYTAWNVIRAQRFHANLTWHFRGLGCNANTTHASGSRAQDRQKVHVLTYILSTHHLNWL